MQNDKELSVKRYFNGSGRYAIVVEGLTVDVFKEVAKIKDEIVNYLFRCYIFQDIQNGCSRAKITVNKLK